MENRYLSSGGYIKYCSGCKKVKLVFNNLKFSFDVDTFEEFRFKINQINYNDYFIENDFLTLRTGDENLGISFRYEEFQELLDLINQPFRSNQKIVEQFFKTYNWN